MTILDEDFFSKIIFYPRREMKPKNTNNRTSFLFEIEKDVSIGGLFFKNSARVPTILFFHGNGEICTDYKYYYKKFFELNVNFAVFDFRGYGFSTSTPKFSKLFSDANIIYDKFRAWLISNNYNSNIFVMGRSLGSTCASEIGANNPEDLLGVIYESGYCSVYHLMRKLSNYDQNIDENIIYPFSNEIRIKKIKKPVFILHGKRDFLIPYSEAESIYNNLNLEDEDKTLVGIPKAGHNDIMTFEEEYFDPLYEFISKYTIENYQFN